MSKNLFFSIVSLLVFIPTLSFARQDPNCIRNCGYNLDSCKSSWESDIKDCKKKCDFDCGFLTVDAAVRQCVAYCEASCEADSSGIDLCLSTNRSCTDACPEVP